MAFSGSYSDASSSRLDLNQQGKVSGISLGESSRGLPEFITAKMGKVEPVSPLAENLPLIIAGAGLLVLLYILKGK